MYPTEVGPTKPPIWARVLICPLCQLPEPHPEQAFHHYMIVFLSRLNEPQRRWFVALEAMRLGHGGKHLLTQITGMSPTTILGGRHELEADLAGCPELHMRAPGRARQWCK
jgi:hypothetical protein